MYTALRKSLNKENDKGFTLIELLVVIIIIGILAAIAIPIFLSQRKKGFEASQKSDARSIATQMETWYTDAQVYPASTDLAWVTATHRVTFGGATGDYVVLSPNNTTKIVKSAGTGGFCIEVKSSATDKTAVYDSGAGGLQPMTATAACNATTYATTVLDFPAAP